MSLCRHVCSHNWDIPNIQQLDGFPSLPSKERFCRCLKKLAKNKADMLTLWTNTLEKANDDHDAITSNMIHDVWAELLAQNKVTGLPDPEARQTDEILLDYTVDPELRNISTATATKTASMDSSSTQEATDSVPPSVPASASATGVTPAVTHAPSTESTSSHTAGSSSLESRPLDPSPVPQKDSKPYISASHKSKYIYPDEEPNDAKSPASVSSESTNEDLIFERLEELGASKELLAALVPGAMTRAQQKAQDVKMKEMAAEARQVEENKQQRQMQEVYRQHPPQPYPTQYQQGPSPYGYYPPFPYPDSRPPPGIAPYGNAPPPQYYSKQPPSGYAAYSRPPPYPMYPYYIHTPPPHTAGQSIAYSHAYGAPHPGSGRMPSPQMPQDSKYPTTAVSSSYQQVSPTMAPSHVAPSSSTGPANGQHRLPSPRPHPLTVPQPHTGLVHTNNPMMTLPVPRSPEKQRMSLDSAPPPQYFGRPGGVTREWDGQQASNATMHSSWNPPIPVQQQKQQQQQTGVSSGGYERYSPADAGPTFYRPPHASSASVPFSSAPMTASPYPEAPSFVGYPFYQFYPPPPPNSIAPTSGSMTNVPLPSSSGPTMATSPQSLPSQVKPHYQSFPFSSFDPAFLSNTPRDASSSSFNPYSLPPPFSTSVEQENNKSGLTGFTSSSLLGPEQFQASQVSPPRVQGDGGIDVDTVNGPPAVKRQRTDEPLTAVTYETSPSVS